MAEVANYPAGWVSTEQYHPEQHLSKARKSSEKEDYLAVAQRMVWFVTEQRQMIAAGVSTTTFALRAEPVEIDYERGVAIFRSYARDVLGNEANDIGSETRADFSDWIEKAATKAKGRALASLGYGTAFSPDLDEGERIVDAPRQPVERRQPTQQPQRQAPQQQRPLSKLPSVEQQCKALADTMGYTPEQRDDLKQQHTVNGQVDYEAVKRQLMQEAKAKGRSA